MNPRFPAILLSGLAIFGLEFGIIIGLEPGLSLKLAAGFLSLFFFPGYCLAQIALERESDVLDRLGFAVIFSLGMFSYPALLFFLLGLDLETVFWVFFIMGIMAWLILLSRTPRDFFKTAPSESEPRSSNLSIAGVVLLLAAGSAVLAWYTGSYRRPGHDWDYYNYISMVRKFLVWGKASIHNYYYIDAPPDPIHAYNLQALLWALVAKQNRIDPVPLYLHSAFLTVPLCFIAFFGFARRALGERPGLVASCFYFFYQLFYGGLFFVRLTTFFPDDSMWLLAFPALLNLAFLCLEQGGGKLFALLAFSALGVSIVHPLWGLAFYLTLSFYLLAESVRASRALANLFDKSGPGPIRAILKYSLLFLLVLPFLFSALYVAFKIPESPKRWFEPLFPGFFLDRPWFYALLLVALPLLIMLFLARPFSKLSFNFKQSEFFRSREWRRVLAMIIIGLVVALPYVYLRWQTVQNTQWSAFGRNPYRGLLTPNLFLLNPLKRSFSDPNMTFYPFFFLGLVLCPGLFWLGKKNRPGALAGFYGLVGVTALVLHPALATLFAKFFTLGYLRRILRLPALFAFLAPPAALEWIFARFKIGKFRAYAVSLLVALALVLAMIPLSGDVMYRNLFQEMLLDLKPEYRETLFWDDAPFQFLREQNLVQPGEVVYSDVFTSFRLTAYLGCYVAVQHKPGVGVPDQDQRRLEEMAFFAPDATPELLRKIIAYRRAAWVIVNRNPEYHIPAYDYPFAHPETIAKLAEMPDFFEKVYDRGDWVIFRVKAKAASGHSSEPVPAKPLQ